MFKFIVIMVVPVLIFLYTCSFGKWLMVRKRSHATVMGGQAAYVIALGSLGLSGFVFWRLLM